MSASEGRSTRGPRGIRLPAGLENAIQQEADARDRSWSAMTTELLEEALRTRRAPGIAFVDGATGRRAVIAGTGIDVWEVIATWKETGADPAELQAAYAWLSPMQLRAALGYYTLYPQEIDVRLEREAQWTPERVQQELPFATPDKPAS